MKHWIKDVLLDLLILVVIVLIPVTRNDVPLYLIWGYSCLLLFARILTFFTPFLSKKSSNTGAPNWFYHLVYLATIGVLIFSGNYYLGGIWALIWILTIIQNLKKKDE